MGTWRNFFRADADVADLLAYPSALAEGRIAGKYLLSHTQAPDTVVVLGFRRRGLLAGADVKIDRAAARRAEIDVAVSPRAGRRGPQPVGTLSLAELTAKASRRFKPAESDPDDPAVLLYTSGTTGSPKGVMLTHRNFDAQCRQVVAHLLTLDEQDRTVGVLPLYHVYGLANGLVASIFFGGALALVPQYTPAMLLDAIRDAKATLLIAVPSMYQHLLALARVRKSDMPNTLRLCVSGGAALPARVMEEFERVFETRIHEGYGLTETTSAVCMNASGEGYKPGSIGRPAPGVRMAVVDGEGREVKDGETGEIVIAGDVVTKGYWENEEATAEQIRDGWLYTGDLGCRDEDGYYFITDRSKDLIIRGGFNISPREIEEVLLACEGVADAAVVGVPDRRGEEAVRAFIVAGPDASPTEQAVLEHCRENLAAYKVPKSVTFTDRIPKSATGKVLRRELAPDHEDPRLLTPEKSDA